MGAVSKSILLFNTIRYLKPKQILNQVTKRFRKSEQFWNYEKKSIEYKPYNLWITGLDDDPKFMDRFKPEALLNNELTLLNETRKLGRWNYSDASHLWNFNVHYLEYLVPLYSLWNSTGDEKYKTKINQILFDWYEVGSVEPDSNQSYTISLRIVNQLIISEAVDDRQRLYESIFAQYRYLIKHQETHLLGNHYLENLKAIVICSVIFDQDDVYRAYIKKLLNELDEEITEDGLHFELSLMYHKIVLEDLIRVAVVLKTAGKSEYGEVREKIQLMVTALYSLERNINRTPLFNDAGDNIAKTRESLLRTCEKLFDIKPVRKEQIAGYYRLDDGKATMIMDCGELSPTYMPGHAHCDCLSFELFYEGVLLFTNSGTYQYQGDKRKYFRSTAAHNTVKINGHEQSELWGEHRAGRRIKEIRGKLDGKSITGSYTNYCGEHHSRTITLEDDTLTVLDKTDGEGESYLHLAPGLKYIDNVIVGNGLKMIIEPVNAKDRTENSFYADEFGKLLDTTWKLKRGTGAKVSNGSIDELYSQAIKAGALGGKLLGAGGGGFLLFYCEKENQENLKKAMEELMIVPFCFENEGTQVLYYAPQSYSPRTEIILK